MMDMALNIAELLIYFALAFLIAWILSLTGAHVDENTIIGALVGSALYKVISASRNASRK